MRRAESNWLFPFTVPKADADEAVEDVARGATTDAPGWFAKVSSLQIVLGILEAKRLEKPVRFGYENYIQQPLALALTRAKLGSVRDAEAELEAYGTKHDLSEDVMEKLLALASEYGKPGSPAQRLTS